MRRKVLSLKKEVICKLNNEEMLALQGGVDDPEITKETEASAHKVCTPPSKKCHGTAMGGCDTYTYQEP